MYTLNILFNCSTTRSEQEKIILMSIGRKVPEFSFLLVYSLQDLFQAIQISGMVYYTL